jgi:hypothetical protein
MPNVPISTFTVPANTVGIGATGYSLTGSASASFMDLAGTWNTSGTPTAIKLNITDSNSNPASLLMDLQVGGASRFGVGKNGRLFSTSGPIGGIALSSSATTTNFFEMISDGGAFFCLGGNIIAAINRSGVKGVSTTWDGAFAFGTSTTNATAATADLLLTRRGAANLRLGAADAAAPVAQTLSVQSVVAGTTNTAGTNFTFTGSQGTGTGAGGSLIFQVAPAGSSGSAQNALATALTIAGSGIVTLNGQGATGSIFVLNGTNLASGQTTSLISNVTASAPSFQIYNNTDDVTSFVVRAGALAPSIQVVAGASIGFSPAVRYNETAADVRLFRDDAGKLALRNGGNAQEFRVYNTFTSSTNFERFRIFAQSSATVLIGTEKGSGGGTARALELQTDATSRLALDTVGSARIVTALTVATLPATPLTGMMARVTDASAPAVGVTVAAGGAAQALCWYNGANWTVIGV